MTGREDYFATAYAWASTPAIGDAREHWERWFSLDNAARIILVPATEAPAEPALDLPSPIAVAPMATEARTLTADELAQRMALPERSSIQSRTLDNGLTLVAAQGGTAASFSRPAEPATFFVPNVPGPGAPPIRTSSGHLEWSLP